MTPFRAMTVFVPGEVSGVEVPSKAYEAEYGLLGSLLGTIARISYRRRWLALGGWLLMVAFLIVAWNRFGAQPDNNFTSTDPGTALINQSGVLFSGEATTVTWIRCGLNFVVPFSLQVGG